MKSLTLTFALLISVSCIPGPKVEKEVTAGNINASAPYIWAGSFPKEIQISHSFSGAEVTAITDMSTAWKTAVNDQETFFTYGARVADISNSISSMDDLLDSVMGVYKTTSWPSSLPSYALAVTQIFGRRYNIGRGDEYVSIEHADILVNEHIFNFDTAMGGPGYDLQTVILHEMGHFLGLQHNSSVDRTLTVMYPSINSTETKRVPQASDITSLKSKYSLALVAEASNLHHAFELRDEEPGEVVKIIIELYPDGKCIHRMNGKIIESH